jgi:prepilin-type processing-associated H-X9-DG protein
VRWGGIFILGRNFTYTFNADMLQAPGRPPSTGIGWSDIVQPADKILIVEEQWANDIAGFIPGGGDEDDIVTNRHNGRGNHGFADGHVESIAPHDIGFDTDGAIVNYAYVDRYTRLFQ